MVIRIKMNGEVVEEYSDYVLARIVIDEVRRLREAFPDADVGLEYDPDDRAYPDPWR